MPADRPRSQLDLDMARLADGDRGAFPEVFRALWPRLLPFCRRALAGAPDADDAAQLALEKVFARASDYDPARPALPWAFTLAAWECATLRRKLQRSRSRGEAGLDRAESSEPSPEEAALRKELEAALRASIAELSPADREALDAAFWDEALPGAKTPAFRKQKERALARLRSLWRLREP